MKVSKVHKCAACVILASITVIDVLSQSPQNAIAVINGQVKFNCAVGASTYTNWVQNTVPGSSSGTVIASGCKIEPSLTANYAAENGSNFCNLIISNVNMQLAGTYACINGFALASYTAILTVIDQNANVAVLNSTALVEDESVNISCSLAYNTSASNLPRLIPTFSVNVPRGQNATAVISDTQTNSVTSIITVKLQRPDLPIFQCLVNFTLTGNLSNGYATNIPSSPVTSWNTSMIYGVLYPARTCSIASETFLNSGICRVNLSCAASANPPANYSWVDVNDTRSCNSLNDKQIFPFAEDGRTYQCTAYNVIKGKEHNTSCTFTVSNQSQSPQPCVISPTTAPTTSNTASQTNATTTSSSQIVAIVLGVLFGVSLVVNIILVAYILKNRRILATTAGDINMDSSKTYEGLNTMTNRELSSIYEEVLESTTTKIN